MTSHNNISILVLNDSEVFAKLVSKTFNSLEHYKCRCIDAFSQALLEIEEHRYDYFFLNYYLLNDLQKEALQALFKKQQNLKLLSFIDDEHYLQKENFLNNDRISLFVNEEEFLKEMPRIIGSIENEQKQNY